MRPIYFFFLLPYMVHESNKQHLCADTEATIVREQTAYSTEPWRISCYCQEHELRMSTDRGGIFKMKLASTTGRGWEPVTYFNRLGIDL